MSNDTNIHQRINQVMARVRGVARDKVHQHHKFKFAGHDSVTEAIRTAMVECGIVQEVRVLSYAREGLRLVADVEVAWVNIDKQDDRVVVMSMGESFGSDRGGPTPQQIGIAVSYAVKIAQLKNFALVGDPTMDAEEEDRGERRSSPAEAPKANGGAVLPDSHPELQVCLSQLEHAANMGETKKALYALSHFKDRISPEMNARIGELASQKLEAFR